MRSTERAENVSAISWTGNYFRKGAVRFTEGALLRELKTSQQTFAHNTPSFDYIHFNEGIFLGLEIGFKNRIFF